MLPQITHADYYAHPGDVMEIDAQDVCLVMADYYVPGFPPMEWLPKLKEKFPEAILVVVSSSQSRADRDISYEVGAAAFFEKHQPPELFLENISALLAGEEGRDLPFRPEVVDPTGRLSPRQLDILVELSRGEQAKSIARNFGVSPETVKTHLSRLYRELDVNSREEAVQWARENGII